MTENFERQSWTQRRRYEFLEWKLFWEGRFIRDDLERTFDISTPQASADIKNYRDIAPENFEYNATEKGFLPSKLFSPRLLKISADRLLLQLRALITEAIPRHDVWFKTLPVVDMAPDIVRSVDSHCLRDILQAMRTRQAIEIHYQSLTSSSWRAIAPHALAFDGHRWHVRAWCCKNEDFRDYVLARIGEHRGLLPAAYDPHHDVEWRTYVALKLCPHPGLTDEQKNAIEKDFGMSGGSRQISVRASLAYYFIKRMNLDLPESPELTPARRQVHLENLAEVEAAIEDAKAQTAVLVAASRAQRESAD